MPQHGTVGAASTVADSATADPAPAATSEAARGVRVAQPVVTARIADLVLADSPRLNGLDLNHARMLAEQPNRLPPICVHRQTMCVIDGMHRLIAAHLNGQETIEIEFFDGDDESAFELAVRANVTHGLPLTARDRHAAAERILRTRPDLSDRAIATTTGLSPKTVAEIRKRETTTSASSRIGRDGRVRPLNAADGRRLASEAIAARPDAPLRAIARQAGISLGTAHDVRERIRAGQDPVPKRLRKDEARPQPEGPAREAPGLERRPDPIDPRELLAGLQRDPSLRYTESGRLLLRWLGSRTISPTEWRAAVDGVSPHAALLIGKVAKGCARAWLEFADELERRTTGHVEG